MLRPNKNERENLATSVYVAICSGAFLLCFLAAWLLPPGLIFNRWAGCVALAGFFLGMPLLFRAAHRSRLDDAIREKIGVLANVRKLSFREQPLRYGFFLGEKFVVEYTDWQGRAHRAVVRSGFFQGVEWVSDEIVDSAAKL